jgi:hypothetical protein
LVRSHFPSPHEKFTYITDSERIVSLSLASSVGILFQGFTNGGIVLSGGLLYTFAAGTSAPQATFSDSIGTLAPNPIVLDAAGRVPGASEIWITDDLAYRFELRDSLNNVLQSQDNVSNSIGVAASLAAPGGSALVGFLQAGVGAVPRTEQDKLREVQVSAADFSGYSSTGATDSTAAINAAIAALPAQGAKLYIPGTPKFNIVVTKPGLTLIGPGNGGGSQGFVAGMQRWEPFNPALPIVQVGDNTKVVSNVGIRDVTLYGANAGVGAVLFGSGAYACSMDDTLHVGFTAYNVKCQGGNFPSSLIRINNCEMPGLAHVGIDMLPASGSSYTSAIYIDHTHMSLGAGGIGIRNDGVTAFASETYIDTPTGAISVQHLKTTALQPFLFCSNLTLDCTGAGIALDNMWSADLFLNNHIRGSIFTLGTVRNNVGTLVPQYANTAFNAFYPNLLNPMISGFMAFPDVTIAGYGVDQSAGFSAAGTPGARDLTIKGNTITLRAGTYAIRDATGTKSCLISIDVNGQLTIDPTPGQSVKITSLAGTGSRAVMASATGVLSAP